MLSSFIDSEENNPIDKKFKNKDADLLIEKIQYTINAISILKGINDIVIDKNKKISFPIPITGILDETTFAVAIEIFPNFKTSGFISVREARKRLVYIAGYYADKFPINLLNVSNYEELQNVYKRGFLDKAKKTSEKLIDDMLSVYEVLGAKSIKIIDNTGFDAKLGSSVPNIGSVNANANYNKEVLREKKFGKHLFDKDLANKYLEKFKAYPKVLAIIKSRMNGNIISEVFIENISLGGGIEVNIIDQVSSSLSFNVNRKWEIQLEFYDKNEL